MKNYKFKYLKRYNEKVSIFDANWVKFLPNEIEIVTDTGQYLLKRDNSLEPTIGYPEQTYNLMVKLSAIYYQDIMSEHDDDASFSGEPDELQLDIGVYKVNDGTNANSDILKLNIDVTYGNNIQYEISIVNNKVNIYHESKPIDEDENQWKFTKESMIGLIDFFNSFGFNLDPKDFNKISE